MQEQSIRQTLKAQDLNQAILNGPITQTMLKLALPTITVLFVQTLIGLLETYFVSSLGTQVMAGVAVVFPILMLMQMLANGGFGGGLSSAVARASGAGRLEDVQSLVWHGVILAGLLGGIFSIVMLIAAPTIYHLMGVTGLALDAALKYSNIIFLGSPLIWAVALLSASLRGAGDTKTPARITLLGGVLLLPISPLLIFGWGFIPSFGVAGAGLAVLSYYVFAIVYLIRHMRATHSIIRLSISPLNLHFFKEILGIGSLSAIGVIQVNLTVIIITTLVGQFGSDAIAGYGIASRLDYIQIPLMFGIGSAIMTMVGINYGAGQFQRAQHITWVGVFISFLITGSIGLFFSIFPSLWLGIFSSDQAVIQTGITYLQYVAPFYGAIGIGMALYFAGQGSKRLLGPLIAGTIRMIIAAFIGSIAVLHFNVSLSTFFQILGLSALTFGLVSCLANFIKNK
ncbi:MATE family efflux transporter [Acinetobacter lactucae]|uniref:MATE family efflux transporter n=1 Tax=Acinetobacter lactucae TaxID=1785128 RepID=UPI00148D00D6|nr:MATE family efflux transporter [Acinetobacter lactucae]